MARLAGKTAVVTGAASGFGEGIAERFAAEGARVCALDLNGPGADVVANRIGGFAAECDVSQASQVNAAAARIIEEMGEVDILVNNAGWSHRNQPLLEVDEAAFDRVYAVNVKSIFLMTHAFLPHWRAIGRGCMINVGSTAGIRPRPGLTWYNSTKGAVHLMTRSLAGELAAENIRVNALAPVAGDTPLLETFMGQPDTPEVREKFIATIPMGRLSTPQDMASAALFLASDDAEFLTGLVMEVDGGRTI